jgi:hypothetical protein
MDVNSDISAEEERRSHPDFLGICQKILIMNMTRTCQVRQSDHELRHERAWPRRASPTDVELDTVTAAASKDFLGMLQGRRNLSVAASIRNAAEAGSEKTGLTRAI